MARNGCPSTQPMSCPDCRPEDAEDAILSACSSLVSVVKANDSQIVQFSHFSVKEYLTSDRLATSTTPNIRNFHAPLESAHMIMVQACVTVLLQLDEKVGRARIEGLPLAIYAAQHWADHARFKNIVLKIQDRIECLLDPTKPHFAAWTWIFDGVGENGRSVSDLEEHPSPTEATPLHYAALRGLSWAIKQLVAQREDMDISGGSYGTPMWAALAMGHLEVAHCCLSLGLTSMLSTRIKVHLSLLPRTTMWRPCACYLISEQIRTRATELAGRHYMERRQEDIMRRRA